MADPETRSYGAWPSPLSAERLAEVSIRLAEPRLAGGRAHWLEARPAESGRSAIVRETADGGCEDLLAPPYSARSRVYEYGGGAYALADDGVWFVEDSDQEIHFLPEGDSPQRISDAPERRFGALVSVPGAAAVIAVSEVDAGEAEPRAELVRVERADGRLRVLAAGRDFYASPRISPDGRQLAWLCWDHPNMPWDGCWLYLADFDADGAVAEPERVAGSATESIFQPEFDLEGNLYFASDITDWWNLYRWNREEIQSLLPMRAEFGLPQWQLGMRTYAVLDSGELLCACSQGGRWYLGWLTPDTYAQEQAWQDAGLDDNHFQGVHAEGEQAVCIAAGADRPPRVLRLQPQGASRTVRSCGGADLSADQISRAEPIEYPSGEGCAHALYYPPRNPDYQAPEDERPPLLVTCHGGPTGAASPALDLRVQFWTTRGFAVLDVNYRGSSGYGRSYREALYGWWGIRDVEDCRNGARHLAERGLADPRRIAIRGSSAGGYTVLCALCFHDDFAAGASYYGIGDLETLARDTHKLESRYVERLVGGVSDARERYRERSPLHSPDGFDCPIIFFQGLDDRVVPPNQAERMVEALRAKRLPVAQLSFPGEGHGFRRSETVRQCLQAELSFYGRLFGFTPPDAGPPVAIENFPDG